MIIDLVHVFIVTVMLILNFVHCEITACDSDNKQSLILRMPKYPQRGRGGVHGPNFLNFGTPP